MVESILYFNSIADFWNFLDLAWDIAELSYCEALKPWSPVTMFQTPSTMNFRSVATRWADDHPLQHVYAIISFSHCHTLRSLKWLQNIFGDCLKFLRNGSGRNVDKNFPFMLWSCLLTFGIHLWLLSQYLSPGPPRKHCSSVLKLDTVSTGFSFSWLGVTEWNSLTGHCEDCWSRCY